MFHGIERYVRRYSGASFIRVSHDSNHFIREHRHDWPTLTIFLAGSAQESFDEGEIALDSPTVIFHPGGASHADRTGEAGLETAGIVFDPAWLEREAWHDDLTRSRIWRGGRVSVLARRLFFDCARAATESDARQQMAEFFRQASSERPQRHPLWLHQVRTAVVSGGRRTTSQLGRAHDVHPNWLAKRYKGLIGEGVQESQRRLRVERSLQLIRNTQLPLAEIAVLAGFCDQSHMNRCFAAVLQTKPTAFVRRGMVAAASGEG